MIIISKIIEFRNVSLLKEGRLIIDNVSFSLKRNAYNVIIGRNGIGKSTILKLITGLEKPNSGEIYTDNVRMKYGEEELYRARKRIGTAFQNTDEELIGTTVLDNLIFVMENNCIPKEEMREYIEKYTLLFNMGDILNKRKCEITESEKCKVAVATSVVSGADIILMDEVSVRADSIMKKEMERIIDILLKEGKTVISVTHDTDEIRKSDFVVYLKEGGLIREGKPEEIFPEYLEEMMNTEFPVYESKREPVNLIQEGDNLEGVTKIVLSEVNFTLGKNGEKIIDNLSVSIPKGKITSIIGKSGSGKTLLLELMSGILLPSEEFSGEISCVKEDGVQHINKNTPEREIKEAFKNFNIVFQHPEEQFFETTVRNEIKYNIIKKYSLNGKETLETDLRIKEAALIFGFDEEFMNKSPFKLSEGEKKMVSLVMAVCLKPEVLLLDEPFAGLDYTTKKKIVKLIEELKKEGVTVILTEKDKGPGYQCSDYFIQLEGKHIKKEAKESRDMKKLNVEEKFSRPSFFHRLDPRSKILSTLIIIILLLITPLFLRNSYYKGYIYISIFLLGHVTIFRLDMVKAIKRMKIYLITAVILTFFNILFMRSGVLLADFGYIKIYDTPIMYSLNIIYQIFLIIVVTEIFTATTEGNEIMKGISYIMGKGNRNSESALMFTVATGFIPTVYEKVRQIIKVQKSRGADFSLKGIRSIEELFLLIIPLFYLTAQKMNKNSEIMSSRNFVIGRERSEYRKLRFSTADYIYMGIVAVFSVSYIYFIL